MKLLELFKPDLEFAETIDDTLLNRLCTTILCHNDYHKDVCSETVSHWGPILQKYFENPSDLIDAHEKLPKMAFSVFLKLSDQLHPALTASVSALLSSACANRDLELLSSFLESVDVYLKNCLNICELNVLSSIFTPEVCSLFHHLSTTVNIFHRRVLLDLLVSLALYNSIQDGYSSKNNVLKIVWNELSHFTQIGQSFLHHLHDMSRKLNVTNVCIVLDSSLPISLIDDSTAFANVIYFTCIQLIQFCDFDPVRGKSLLETHPNFPIICSRVIGLYLRHHAYATGTLWTFVLHSWSDYILQHIDQPSSLVPLVNPLPCVPKHILTFERAAILLDQILHYAFRIDRVDDKVFHFDCHVLLKIVPLLVCDQLDSDFIAKWISNLKAFVCSRTLDSSPASLSATRQALLVYELLCSVLSAKNQTAIVSGALEDLLTLLEECENQEMFVLICRTLSGIMNQVSCLDPCLLSQFGFTCCLSLLRSLSREERIEDMVYLLRACIQPISKLQDCSLKFCTADQFDSFLQCLRAIPHVQKLDIEIRGIVACIILQCLCSFDTTDISSSPTSCDVLFQQLIDFDFTELTGFDYLIQWLHRISVEIPKLNQLSDADKPSSETLASIYKRLKVNVFEQLLHGSVNFVDHESCPECGENVTRLLDDLFIAHPSSMPTDCTEG